MTLFAQRCGKVAGGFSAGVLPHGWWVSGASDAVSANVRFHLIAE
ncbi:MAG: hypothetical protein V7742_20105 [Halioglobus sp.]